MSVTHLVFGSLALKHRERSRNSLQAVQAHQTGYPVQTAPLSLPVQLLPDPEAAHHSIALAMDLLDSI